MRLLAVVGVAAVAVAAGCDDDAPRPAAQTPTPTPAPAPESPSRPVRLTIGVSGDLLPHMPVVSRAHVLAQGDGYDFRPMFRRLRAWVRRNSLSFCHVETPLTPAPPTGYPIFNSPPALARTPTRMGAATTSGPCCGRSAIGCGATRWPSATSRRR